MKHRGGLECEGPYAEACCTDGAGYWAGQRRDERQCEDSAGAQGDLYLPQDSRPVCFLMSSKMELLGSSVLQGQDSVKKVLRTKDTDKGWRI